MPMLRNLSAFVFVTLLGTGAAAAQEIRLETLQPLPPPMGHTDPSAALVDPAYSREVYENGRTMRSVGVTLVAIGGASIIASIVLSNLALSEPVGSDGRERYTVNAIFSLLGAGASFGVGVPL